MLAFLYYLNLKNKVGTVISHIHFDSKYDIKCHDYYQFISIWSFTNIPTLPTSFNMGQLDWNVFFFFIWNK